MQRANQFAFDSGLGQVCCSNLSSRPTNLGADFARVSFISAASQQHLPSVHRDNSCRLFVRYQCVGEKVLWILWNNGVSDCHAFLLLYGMQKNSVFFLSTKKRQWKFISKSNCKLNLRAANVLGATEGGKREQHQDLGKNKGHFHKIREKNRESLKWNNNKNILMKMLII